MSEPTTKITIDKGAPGYWRSRSTTHETAKGAYNDRQYRLVDPRRLGGQASRVSGAADAPREL